MTCTNLGRELKALNAMNNSRMWMTRMTPGRELRVLDAMKSLWVWRT